MRLRTFRRQLERVLGRSTDRQLKEHRRRAGELEQAFRKLNAQIPALNAAASDASEDARRLAEVLRALGANYAESAAIFSQWADEIFAASKVVR
jgi:septal ring factor EnvC (AmiA/AmiB activator)